MNNQAIETLFYIPLGMKFTWTLWKNDCVILKGNHSDLIFQAGDYLKQVEQWCQSTGNGRRINHNMFQFNTPCEKTAFLLRWS